MKHYDIVQIDLFCVLITGYLDMSLFIFYY